MNHKFLLLIGLFWHCYSNAQILNIPDARFKLNLLNASSSNSIAKNQSGTNVKIDTNADGEIQVSEAILIYELTVSYTNILNLNGVEGFANLKKLTCNASTVTTINASGLTNLEYLSCNNTALSTLNVAGLTHLSYLSCRNAQLNTLDLANLTSLVTLDCSTNQIAGLDCSGLSQLESLNCSSNQLAFVNLTGCAALDYIDCHTNFISVLDLTDCAALIQLDCYGNQIASLDLSQNHLLWTLDAYNNAIANLNLSGCHNLSRIDVHSNALVALDASDCYELTDLNFNTNNVQILLIKNGSYEVTINPANNPNLNYVCCDENQASGVRSVMNVYGYPNCTINTYCSFSPGGEYYNLVGNARWAGEDNACDLSDQGYPHLKFSIQQGTTNQTNISDASGSYNLALVAGTYSVTPILENPSYFDITPTFVNVTFPNTSNPTISDFCVKGNGSHSDVKITILPLNGAVPGFDIKYKIVYENIGNLVESGTISLDYNDLIMDLVAADPVVDYTSLNKLYWNFSNLQPFEKRVILVRLNLNSTVETPAVYAGDFLGYLAYLSLNEATDENIRNNRSELKQLVVNSYDPNDKTCIQGATIDPGQIGEYVDYIIRFENNGTANATNVVVSDLIDTAKFDLSTLVPTDASHELVTRISGSNKVEFIFENINLPFDNENNDGYVAFKIKTKPTLVIGDSFSNSASIFFDYNAPITTNTAETLINLLQTTDFEFSDYFKIYPNPASSILKINSTGKIEMSSLAVYNTLGQLVMVIPNAQHISELDISVLKTGNYFIKINSDRGTACAKFAKN